MKLITSLVLSLSLLFSGCVIYDCGYTSNESIMTYNLASAKKIPITFSVELQDYWNIHIPINSFWAPDKSDLKEKIKQALAESNLFSSVVEAPESQANGYHFNFRFYARGADDGDSSAAGVIAGISFFIIPAWEDAGFDGSVAVRLRGKTIYSSCATEKQCCFGWLPLAPIGVIMNGALAWHCTEKGVINSLVNDAAEYHYYRFCTRSLK